MNIFTEWLYQYFDEVEPMDFYRDIFPEGELQKTGVYTKGKYNGIFVAVTDQKRIKKNKNTGKEKEVPVVKRYTITDDLESIQTACDSDYFCLCSPLSYVGKERTSDNARFLYAMVFDLDNIRTMESGLPVGLMNLWDAQIINIERIPKPTYIVSSGTGLHLYYVFERAIPLYDSIAKQLQKYKHELTRIIWNDTIVNIKSADDIQYEGIYQGFRMPGTRTKVSKEDRARAFQTGDKVTMEYMNEFVDSKYQVTDFQYKSKLSLADAKEKYPDWYDWKIVQGNKGVQNPWCVNRNVYEWWKKKIYGGATVNHRYYCLWILSMYAQKCSYYDEKKNPNPVTYEELESDAWDLLDYLDSMTISEDNHFTKSDVQDALEGFQDKLITYPLNSIENRSAIHVERNKRNKRKRKDHVKLMNYIRDEINRNVNWRDGNGRPKGSGTKESIIKEYRESHPDDSVSAVAKNLGISRTTVYKYWNN